MLPKSEAAEYKSYGIGRQSCGSWVEDRRAGSYYDMAQWMLGYISAAGYYGAGDLKESEHKGFVVYMDKYCQRHTLEQFETGVQKLVEELRLIKP